MRSPDYLSAQDKLKKIGGKVVSDSSDPLSPSEVEITSSYCGNYKVGTSNVDLYYWPEPDVNTSCLDIIGTTVNPISYGATTEAFLNGLYRSTSGPSQTFWACPAENPVTLYLIETSVIHSTVTTASLTNIGSLDVKVSLFNPWSSSPYIKTDITPPSPNSSNSSIELHTRYRIQAREYSLIILSSITKENSSPISTTVLRNFTLLVL